MLTVATKMTDTAPMAKIHANSRESDAEKKKRFLS